MSEQKTITAEELMEIIHRTEWMEDTSFEQKPRTGGDFFVEEHIWSMNSDHVRTAVEVDERGRILAAGGYDAVEELKTKGVIVKES